MSQTDPPPPLQKNRMPPVLQVLGWTIWVLEVIAFLWLFGCAFVFQANPRVFAIAIPGMLLGLAVFIYGVWLSFSRTAEGGRRGLLGSAVILVAGFVIFGSCTVIFD